MQCLAPSKIKLVWKFDEIKLYNSILSSISGNQSSCEVTDLLLVWSTSKTSNVDGTPFATPSSSSSSSIRACLSFIGPVDWTGVVSA